MTWNPWKRIRQLEAMNTRLLDQIDYERERAEEIVGRAIDAHYRREQYRTRALEAQNAMLLENSLKISSLTPSTIWVAKEGLGDE